MRASPLWLFRVLSGVFQELFPSLFGAEVIGLALVDRLRRGRRIHREAADRIGLFPGLLLRRMPGMWIGRRLVRRLTRDRGTWRQLCADVP